jgi:hypothetical protein
MNPLQHAISKKKKPSDKGKDKHWIQGAIKHKGALTKKANNAGESPMEFAHSHDQAPGKTGKQARLAETLYNMNH